MAIGSYTFKTVTVPGAAGGTWLGGINNAGEVSGSYLASFPGTATDPPYPYSFTESNGVITNLGDRTANQATGAINNAGQVVGTTGSAVSGIVGFIWTDSAQRISSSVPGSFTHAFGINDSGVVVGGYTDKQINPGDTSPAFVWQAGTMTSFQQPGASTTEAHGINNAGIIVGTADNYGFIDMGGQISLLGIAGATVVNAEAINNNNVVVGSYNDGTHWHGFIDDGTMHFIDAPGASDTKITGINDSNQLVGAFSTAGGPPQGFIATDPPSADSVTTLVRQEYVGLFGHDADPGAQTFWTNELKAGAMTPRDFVWALTQSAESQWLHGGQTDAQFVNSVYENALGRPAESNTQTNWASAMASSAGPGRWDVESAISTSLEGQIHFAATHA